MAYYKRLRELREDHDKSQREIADYLHVTQPQYWRYEKGYRDVPTEFVVRLAEYYDVSTDYILEHKRNNENNEKR